MARLSNIFRRHDDPEPGPPIRCRPAARREIESGLRLILSDASGAASDEAILDFLLFAVHRRIDVNLMWVAERGNHIVWALLPLVSPGRTMLLLSPGRLYRKTPASAARLLVEAVCRHFSSAGQIVLAQVLLDSRDRSVRSLYRTSGFEDLAELVYLQKSLTTPARSAIKTDWELITYASDSHLLFADTITRSYHQSLDCPGLNGKREIDDVIAGHRATGSHDPSLWFVLSRSGTGHGVVLLNPTVTGESVELVYLGVTPESRGQGLGDHLIQLALQRSACRGFHELALAVDSRNVPALRLYYRHGLKRVGSRQALIRDLRRPV